jgi:hypothetical protein
VSGDELRGAEDQRFETARKQLSAAQRLAAAAVTALLASAVLLWASPRDEPIQRLVLGRTASGGQICGTLSGQGSTALVLAHGSGMLIRDLDRVRVVERCPRRR